MSIASAFAPRRFLQVFGVAHEDNGAARLAWRLFAVRTAGISLLAARGDRTAQEPFLPTQILDQAAWWWGYRRGELSLRTAGLAAAASAAIIALDLKRRTG